MGQAWNPQPQCYQHHALEPISGSVSLVRGLTFTEYLFHYRWHSCTVLVDIIVERELLVPLNLVFLYILCGYNCDSDIFIISMPSELLIMDLECYYELGVLPHPNPH